MIVTLTNRVGAASRRLISNGRTIWIADAHGYGKRFIVRAEEILIAFVELEREVLAMTFYLQSIQGADQ